MLFFLSSKLNNDACFFKLDYIIRGKAPIFKRVRLEDVQSTCVLFLQNSSWNTTWYSLSIHTKLYRILGHRSNKEFLALPSIFICNSCFGVYCYRLGLFYLIIIYKNWNCSTNCASFYDALDDFRRIFRKRGDSYGMDYLAAIYFSNTLWCRGYDVKWIF